MAMANIVSRSSSTFVAPQNTKSSSSRSKKSLYSPPISFPRCLSRRLPLMHATEPISALNKENFGLVCNMNRKDSFGFNPLLFPPNFKHKDNKFQCHWGKADALAEAQEDTNSNKTNIHRSTRGSGSKLHPKIYAFVVGASICAMAGLCALGIPKLRTPHYMDVPYSDLVGGIQDESVIRVQFVDNSRQIYFNKKSIGEQNDQTPQTDSLTKRLWGASKISIPKWQYHTRNVEDDKYELLRLLKEKGITYGSNPALLSASMKNFLFVFFQVAPFWIMVLLTCYQLSIQHDLGKITKRKPSKKQSVIFDDVEGVDAAKSELLEIVLCMKGDKRYTKLGAKLPKGVLLTGPPGTGKTLLARAVAGEAGVSFFSISASELVEVFVGRGAARVRDLFREARKNSPSIIFIDEIDAVGGQRGRTLNCERDQTLNQLLTDMDGFEKEASVVVIAATNRPETLDSALMRPGRFSRKVRVDEPDETGRKKIFALYLRDVPMEDDKEAICDLVAFLTPGLVGADLENIAHESVLLAARRGGEFVTKDDVVQAVDRARAKVYDHAVGAKPFGFEPLVQERVQGGSMGFGFSN